MFEETVVRIREVLANYESPVLMWSGGKDSMALLHCVAQAGDIPPVLHYREPGYNHKFDFHQQVAEEYGLQIYHPPPLTSGVRKQNGVLELTRHYNCATAGTILIPLSLYEPGPWSGQWRCGVDMLDCPHGTMDFPWDLVLHGHKSCDTDAFYGGRVPLDEELKINEEGPDVFYPLADWTDKFLWKFLVEHRVPIDTGRYDISAQKEHKSKTWNSDWYEGCTRCLDPDGPDEVFCPKLGRDIPNMSDLIQIEPPHPTPGFTVESEE